MNLYIPKEVKIFTDKMMPQINDVGRSNSSILKYYDSKNEYYLKISEHCSETIREIEALKWLSGKVPVPDIIACHYESDKVYLLISTVKGEMSCSDRCMDNPEDLVYALADGIKQLQQIDTQNCNLNSRLDKMLDNALQRIKNNKIDIADLKRKTGYISAMELYEYLVDNKPKEELVFTHGDFCLPNIFINSRKTTGFIDLGRAGVSDKWVDIAICIRSLAYNLGTNKYTSLFFDILNIEPDTKKIEYYTLLDEI